jgi:hypothetical protein
VDSVMHPARGDAMNIEIAVTAKPKHNRRSLADQCILGE